MIKVVPIKPSGAKIFGDSWRFLEILETVDIVIDLHLIGIKVRPPGAKPEGPGRKRR
jgi:hypothetical protein